MKLRVQGCYTYTINYLFLCLHINYNRMKIHTSMKNNYIFNQN